ncbi:MAG: hypothetical protein Q4C76_04165 [Bacillota bacterium]|nr:hypothetical protein [Bacillota bacterium]
MTDPMAAKDAFNQALLQLSQAAPAVGGLLIQEAEALMALSAHDSRVCRQTLALCQPAMAALGAQVDDRWLAALYDQLTANLFPDETTGHVRRPLDPAETLYLAVLELVLSQPVSVSDSLLDLLPLPEDSIPGSRVELQYRRFRKLFGENHVVTLMRLGREIMPFDPASHTIGVHNVALHTAKMAKLAGIPVDLPLVSAAALGHDVGKFGCRGEDAQRIPYLHYYYTWQWFSEHDMEDIGYISANHSTWDLEFENLPMESLLLIYADFRVRGSRENGKETMAIYSLAEAYDMIFSKLYNMTEEKQLRYRTVYAKLRDFETYLTSHGVPVDLDREQLEEVQSTDPALLSPDQALQGLRNMTLENSIRLMNMVSTDESFEQLLEQAKGEKNLQRIRTYLHLLEEYSTYMTKANKQKALTLLYELLMHPDGDVRRKAGSLMGQILANSGPKYRKERPGGARKEAITPTMMALLDESVSLWEKYIHLCLRPQQRVSPSHALRISNSLKTICHSLFAHCDGKEAQPLLEPLLHLIWETDDPREQFILIDALGKIPWACLPKDAEAPTIQALGRMLHSQEVRLQIAALLRLEELCRQRPGLIPQIRPQAESFVPWDGEHRLVLTTLRCRVLGLPAPSLSSEEASEIYLSNLKAAVHWMVKLVQIDLLCARVDTCPDSIFHTAMHLSNLLSVSEHLPVREYAGQCLIRLAPRLAAEQINEIAIDLLRELESGQEQISQFIPPYAGPILCLLPEKELREAIVILENLVRRASGRAARAALYTLGEILNVWTGDEDMVHRVLGILMSGVSHYEEDIHQTALAVLCREVFGSRRLSPERKNRCFTFLHKKLLTILSEPREGRLTFFNRAAMLNHLYRFLVQYEVTRGPFVFPARKPAAFFPGTFDPFSVGHKRIVEEIRSLGYEVYLAVDEFSWSKQTLAKLLRRQIVSMSVADQWDTYLFPDDIPINIAMPRDLARLRSFFPDQDLCLVAGSDVIRHASAYRSTLPCSAPDFDHIIFCRDREEGPPMEEIIRGKVRLISLPAFFDTVSSTRIREYVDQNLDISMLVDPAVQSLIYQYSLYLRSPERKDILRRQDLFFRTYRSRTGELPETMNRLLTRGRDALGSALFLRPSTLWGWTVGHTLHSADLYEVIGTLEGASFVRQNTSGRILFVDQVCLECPKDQEPAACRMLLNELLARSLERDHTYALCRCQETEGPLAYALEQLGFLPIPGQEDIFCVDMRSPMMLLQDGFLHIKKPYRDSDRVKAVVARIRPRLRSTLAGMFPGKLVLCFDSEMLNQALMERVETLNGVKDVPPGQRRLGPCMCVPYGKILADEIVPNTVTKTLHVEKSFDPDIHSFQVTEYPGYSPLKNQVRTLLSFQRPVILVDDLLHKGHRMEKLDRILKEEGLDIQKIIVAVMSGYGRDLMRLQGRQVDCEYFIPNLHYWMTESLLYPFLGGDSVAGRRVTEGMLPSINLILPYIYPNFLADASDGAIRQLSQVALENACALMKALEQEHQQICSTALSLRRLGEVLQRPRLPDRGGCLGYDVSLPPSACLEDDLIQLRRLHRKEGHYYEV